MPTHASVRNRDLPNSAVLSPLLAQFVSLLRRTLLVCLLLSLIWLPGLFADSALAMPAATAIPGVNASPMAKSAAEDDFSSALLACLPKQLSEPSLKRALSEMSDDQLERAFNLKSNPKLSQAEIELKSCLNRKGFAG